MRDSEKGITPEESHKLATAPLPAFNVIPSKLYAGSNVHVKVFTDDSEPIIPERISGW